MSLAAEKSESSSRKRLHSDNAEVKPEQPQEFLPDLDDPDAIDAFFRRSRRQRSPAHEASEGTLPNNHPMKEFVEQPENREMSVKEALARGFRNYRVRLPKIRRVLAPAEFQPGTFIPEFSSSNHRGSLEASCSGVDHSLPSTSQAILNLPQEDSILLTEPTPTNLNEMLSSTYTRGDIMELGTDLNKSSNDTEHYEQNAHIPSASIPSISYPLRHFWQLNPYVSKGYKGGFYVQGNKYVQVTPESHTYFLVTLFLSKESRQTCDNWKKLCITKITSKTTFFRTLINNNQFSVSFNEPITFEINEKTIILTLKELFAANGIIILNEKNVEQLQEVFNSSFLLINNCIAQFLLNSQRTGSDESVTLTRSRNRRKISIHNPIVLSETIPPFACYQLPLFLMSLGTQFGENEILDKSHFPTNTDTPAISKPVSPEHPPYPVEHYDQESSTSTTVITKEPGELSLRQKFLVISSAQEGTETSEVAHQFGINREQVENIIHNRSNIQQAATQMFIEESREEAVVRKITENMNNINEQSQIRNTDSPPKELRTIKKNRVRRTSFVGLNVLMWRFFRECADNNSPLNGKQLKEQAMIIARKLGLDQFKGSEGWLDAFKRRHKIDLKQMTGSPANYEDEGIEETTDVRMEQEEIGNEEGHNSAESRRSSPLYFGLNSNAATNGSVTAALLNTVEKASQPTALASISNTIPLDLQYLLGETAEADLISGLMSSTTPSPYMLTGVPGFASSNLRDSSSESNQQSDERGLIAAVVRSAAVHIPDKEISFAMDTIRSYILTHDSAAMPKFLELQLQLANIAKNVSKTVAPTESKCYSK